MYIYIYIYEQETNVCMCCAVKIKQKTQRLTNFCIFLILSHVCETYFIYLYKIKIFFILTNVSVVLHNLKCVWIKNFTKSLHTQHQYYKTSKLMKVLCQ